MESIIAHPSMTIAQVKLAVQSRDGLHPKDFEVFCLYSVPDQFTKQAKTNDGKTHLVLRHETKLKDIGIIAETPQPLFVEITTANATTSLGNSVAPLSDMERGDDGDIIRARAVTSSTPIASNITHSLGELSLDRVRGFDYDSIPAKELFPLQVSHVNLSAAMSASDTLRELQHVDLALPHAAAESYSAMIVQFARRHTVLDGYRLLLACSAQLPEDIQVASIVANEPKLADVAADELWEFVNLHSLDVSANELPFYKLGAFPALLELKVACNGIRDVGLINVPETVDEWRAEELAALLGSTGHENRAQIRDEINESNGDIKGVTESNKPVSGRQVRSRHQRGGSRELLRVVGSERSGGGGGDDGIEVPHETSDHITAATSSNTSNTVITSLPSSPSASTPLINPPELHHPVEGQSLSFSTSPMTSLSPSSTTSSSSSSQQSTRGTVDSRSGDMSLSSTEHSSRNSIKPPKSRSRPSISSLSITSTDAAVEAVQARRSLLDYAHERTQLSIVGDPVRTSQLHDLKRVAICLQIPKLLPLSTLGFTVLTTLDLSYNFITPASMLQLSLLPYLQDLNLSSNDLHFLPPSLSAFTSLRRLSLRRNKLGAAGIISARTHYLSGLTVRQLLSKQNLEKPPKRPDPSPLVSSDLPSITGIVTSTSNGESTDDTITSSQPSSSVPELSREEIDSALDYLSSQSQEEADLVACQLVVEALMTLPVIEEIDLSENMMIKFPLPPTSTSILTSNNVQSSSNTNTSNAKGGSGRPSISSTLSTNIPTSPHSQSPFPWLRTLSLASNRIPNESAVAACARISRLTWLDLRGNPFTSHLDLSTKLPPLEKAFPLLNSIFNVKMTLSYPTSSQLSPLSSLNPTSLPISASNPLYTATLPSPQHREIHIVLAQPRTGHPGSTNTDQHILRPRARPPIGSKRKGSQIESQSSPQLGFMRGNGRPNLESVRGSIRGSLVASTEPIQTSCLRSQNVRDGYAVTEVMYEEINNEDEAEETADGRVRDSCVGPCRTSAISGQEAQLANETTNMNSRNDRIVTSVKDRRAPGSSSRSQIPLKGGDKVKEAERALKNILARPITDEYSFEYTRPAVKIGKGMGKKSQHDDRDSEDNDDGDDENGGDGIGSKGLQLPNYVPRKHHAQPTLLHVHRTNTVRSEKKARVKKLWEAGAMLMGPAFMCTNGGSSQFSGGIGNTSISRAANGARRWGDMLLDIETGIGVIQDQLHGRAGDKNKSAVTLAHEATAHLFNESHNRLRYSSNAGVSPTIPTDIDKHGRITVTTQNSNSGKKLPVPKFGTVRRTNGTGNGAFSGEDRPRINGLTTSVTEETNPYIAAQLERVKKQRETERMNRDVEILLRTVSSTLADHVWGPT